MTSELTILVASIELDRVFATVKIDCDFAMSWVDSDCTGQAFPGVIIQFALLIEKLDLLDRKHRPWTVEPNRVVRIGTSHKSAGPEREPVPASSQFDFLRFSRLAKLRAR
jgi:hypothetical protein